MAVSKGRGCPWRRMFESNGRKIREQSERKKGKEERKELRG
jgi:hypothetical protein